MTRGVEPLEGIISLWSRNPEHQKLIEKEDLGQKDKTEASLQFCLELGCLEEILLTHSLKEVLEDSMVDFNTLNYYTEFLTGAPL